jgi:hypothetical protein
LSNRSCLNFSKLWVNKEKFSLFKNLEKKFLKVISPNLDLVFGTQKLWVSLLRRLTPNSLLTLITNHDFNWTGELKLNKILWINEIKRKTKRWWKENKLCSFKSKFIKSWDLIELKRVDLSRKEKLNNLIKQI